jgi:hypothetical protein
MLLNECVTYSFFNEPFLLLCLTLFFLNSSLFFLYLADSLLFL